MKASERSEEMAATFAAWRKTSQPQGLDDNQAFLFWLGEQGPSTSEQARQAAQILNGMGCNMNPPWVETITARRALQRSAGRAFPGNRL
ncbi:MAG: hypothetical protein PHS57_02205 [Alphaproteobacteria bacterium]|nr:hypothetical protein [Alphaproteobacteria bacterium]